MQSLCMRIWTSQNSCFIYFILHYCIFLTISHRVEVLPIFLGEVFVQPIHLFSESFALAWSWKLFLFVFFSNSLFWMSWMEKHLSFILISLFFPFCLLSLSFSFLLYLLLFFFSFLFVFFFPRFLFHSVSLSLVLFLNLSSWILLPKMEFRMDSHGRTVLLTVLIRIFYVMFDLIQSV